MEDTESVRAVCSATPTALDGTGDLVAGDIKTGQVGLGVGSWPSNGATEGSNPKATRLYFVILLKNVEKIFDWH